MKAPKRPRCAGLKAGQVQCPFSAKSGLPFCGIHDPETKARKWAALISTCLSTGRPPPADYRRAWVALMGRLRDLALVATVDGGATPEQRVVARLLAAVSEIAKTYHIEVPT